MRNRSKVFRNVNERSYTVLGSRLCVATPLPLQSPRLSPLSLPTTLHYTPPHHATTPLHTTPLHLPTPRHYTPPHHATTPPHTTPLHLPTPRHYTSPHHANTHTSQLSPCVPMSYFPHLFYNTHLTPHTLPSFATPCYLQLLVHSSLHSTHSHSSPPLSPSSPQLPTPPPPPNTPLPTFQSSPSLKVNKLRRVNYITGQNV